MVPITLNITFEIKTSAGRHLEDITHAHIVSLLYKLVTSAKDTDGLSIGSDRNRDGRQKLTNNKNKNEKLHVRFMRKDVFGSAQRQEKHTYGLGYKLTLT